MPAGGLDTLTAAPELFGLTRLSKPLLCNPEKTARLFSRVSFDSDFLVVGVTPNRSAVESGPPCRCCLGSLAVLKSGRHLSSLLLSIRSPSALIFFGDGAISDLQV